MKRKKYERKFPIPHKNGKRFFVVFISKMGKSFSNKNRDNDNDMSSLSVSFTKTGSKLIGVPL